MKILNKIIKSSKIELNLTTKDINDAGINTLIIDGNYHFTPIYYNKSYGFVFPPLKLMYCPIKNIVILTNNTYIFL